MSMTLTNVTSFVRSMIGEPTAKYWTDAEIALYIQMASARVQAGFFSFLWHHYKTVVDFGVTIATSLYNYPSDAYKVVSLQVKADGKNLRKIEEDEYYTYVTRSTGSPTAWMLQGGRIELLPVPSATDSDYLLCWYMKNLTISINPSTTTIDFPDSCKALIGVEAAILARGKDNAVTQDILGIKTQYEQAVMMDLSMSLMSGQSH